MSGGGQMATWKSSTGYKDCNNTYLIVSTAGVWQLKPKCAFQWTRREGPGHTDNSTILFLKDAHSRRCFDSPPKVHQQFYYHNTALTPLNHDFHDIPPHPITITQPTSCVGGATPPPHSQWPFTYRQPLLCPPFHLGPHLTESASWQANGGGVVKGQRSRSRFVWS